MLVRPLPRWKSPGVTPGFVLVVHPCCQLLCSKKILRFAVLMLLVGWFLLLALPASADAGGAALLARRICRVLFPHPCCFGNEMIRINPKNQPSPLSLVAQRVGFESPFFLLAFSCIDDSMHDHDQES